MFSPVNLFTLHHLYATMGPVMTTDPPNLDVLRDEAVRLLTLHQGTPAEERTPIIRALAKVIVTARGGFLNEEGEPDYRGLTHSYRRWVHDLYDTAHINRENRQQIQAAVRYHAGTVLRETLDEETLERLGLLKQTPKERSTERNANRNALVNALSHGELRRGDMLALSAAYTLLSNIQGEDFPRLSRDERRTVARSLVEMQRKLAALRTRLDAEADAKGDAPRGLDADGPDYTADE